MQGLYAIADVPDPAGHEPSALIDALLGEPGARPCVIQLRAKRASASERTAWLAAAGPGCAAVGVPLLVNDDVEVALAGIQGVCGVHLGQGDPGFDAVGPIRARALAAGIDGFTIGISTHDPEQLRLANRQRPDYVAYGPVLPTRNKDRPDAVVGLEGLLLACRLSGRPVVAIGGLDRRAALEAVRLGAAAVAMIGALRGPTLSDVRASVAELVEAVARARQPFELEAVLERVPVLDREQLIELARLAGDLGASRELGLPLRFRPPVDGDRVRYRPCDVLDLLYTLDKKPDESWEAWGKRGPTGGHGLVVLRRPVGARSGG